MINAQELEIMDKNDINIGIERSIKKRLLDKSRKGNDIVCTLGIGITYNEMSKLMKIYDINDDDTFDEDAIYIVTGSDERVGASGIVFTGANNEKMFFGLLGNEPTKKPHSLEDINSISENQSWCIGKIEFNIEEPSKKKEDSLSSLLRSCIVYFQNDAKS